MRPKLRAIVPVALLTGALAVGVSACGNSSKTSSSNSPSSSASVAPTAPLASLASLNHGVSTSVRLDPGFVSALQSLKVTPGVVAPATMSSGSSSISFPITGGNVTYYKPGGPVEPYVQGVIHHSGGISLTAGGTTVDLTNFTIDPGASVLYADVSANGKSVAKQAKVFFLDGRTLQPLQKSGNDVIQTGTTVEIYPSAATLLDQTFNTQAIKPYFKVGVATITIGTS